MLIQEDYFKNIFNTVREGILVLDVDMRVLSANRSFFNIFKVDSAKTIGSFLYDLGNGQWNIPHLRVLLEDILPKHDTVDDYEIEHKFESIGQKTMLLNACKILENRNNQPIILLAIEDISERKEFEIILAATEGKYHELVQNANSIILKMDPAGRVTFFNEFAEKFFGYNEEEMLGCSVVGTIVPATTSSGSPGFDIDSMMKAIGTNQEKYTNNENENMLRNGERVWVAWTNRAIRDEFGNVKEILCIGNDITERKRLEDLLTESEERYRRLFETASDGIVLLEKNEGHITHINPAAEKMLGHSEEECIGKKLQDIGVSLDMNDFSAIMQTLNKSGIINYDDVTVKTKSGQDIYADIYMVDRARLAQCNIRDVTKHKKLEEQLRQAQKMEAVGLLAGGIAHDFNNILSAIVGYGSLLQTKMNSDDPLRENVDQILVSADRAAEVTHSLLAFSKKQVLNPKPININAMIKRLEKLLSRLIGEDIELRTNCTDKDLISMADAGQIEQVLLNLVTNARAAMPHGGQLTLDTQLVELDDSFIRVHGYGEPGMFAVISVSDTGIGMDKETMAKIFEPFFTTKDAEKGAGLGLAMAYGIIKQHNGYINVYSEPESGTTFRIYLPAIESAAEVFVKPAIEPLPSNGNETILVAEDDGALRKLFSTILQAYGYKVILAKDGEDAIRKFMDNKDKIQLLMLDMIMPKKSGKEVYDKIKQMRPDVKILFSSGYTADRIDKDSMLKGGFDFIMKPVSPKDLLKKIRELLDK